MASQSNSGSGKLDILRAVAEMDVSARFEGRNPDLRTLIQRLEQHGLGVPIYWQTMAEQFDEQPIVAGEIRGQLVGYVLPFDNHPTKVLAFFDNQHTHILVMPADDPVAAATFQQTFRPGTSPLTLVSDTYEEVEGDFLSEAPCDYATAIANVDPSNGMATIDAIRQVVGVSRQLKAARDMAVNVTGRVLVEELTSLLAPES